MPESPGSPAFFIYAGASRDSWYFPGMTTVTITLRDEDRQFIESAMKSGRYVSESEAMADAIAELRAREALRQARLAELRVKVTIGIDQLDRGEGAEWNIDDIRAKGQALLASRKPAA